MYCYMVAHMVAETFSRTILNHKVQSFIPCLLFRFCLMYAKCVFEVLSIEYPITLYGPKEHHPEFMNN